jgi:hypothetical protein
MAFTRFCTCAQGTFQNLDFEQAIDVPTYPGSPFIWTANALPGWTVYAGGIPQTEVGHNTVLLAVAALGDSSPWVLDGKFSAILAGPGLSFVTPSIAQSGTIPAGSESLRVLALGGFLVSFAGHPVPLQFLASGPGGGAFCGADISAYAGQYGQLAFQIGPFSSGGVNLLDDISFSTQAIPEPGALPMLGLVALVLSLRSSGRRVRSAEMRRGRRPSVVQRAHRDC